MKHSVLKMGHDWTPGHNKDLLYPSFNLLKVQRFRLMTTLDASRCAMFINFLAFWSVTGGNSYNLNPWCACKPSASLSRPSGALYDYSMRSPAHIHVIQLHPGCLNTSKCAKQGRTNQNIRTYPQKTHFSCGEMCMRMVWGTSADASVNAARLASRNSHRF